MTSSGLSVVLSSFMTFLCSSSSTVWSTLHPVWQNNTLSYPWPIPLRHPSFPTHNQVLGFYLPKAFQTSLLFPISNNHHLSSSQHNLLPRLLQHAGLTSSPFSTVISVIFSRHKTIVVRKVQRERVHLRRNVSNANLGIVESPFSLRKWISLWSDVV